MATDKTENRTIPKKQNNPKYEYNTSILLNKIQNLLTRTKLTPGVK